MKLLIIGGGPSGCLIARRAAEDFEQLEIEILEKRDHIAGNCYDYYDEAGILTHKYGPHYFRTSSKEQLDWLSRFTDWIPADYFVKCQVEGELYSFPVNLNTMSQVLGRDCTVTDFEEFLAKDRVPIENPANAEEQCLARVGEKLYKMFFEGYTLKQWGVPATSLEAEITARIPLRFDHNERYVNETYQQMPKEGYTRWFSNMVDHPRIGLRYKEDFFDLKDSLKRDVTVYTGELDRYFDYRFGKLKYRSLRFEKTIHENTDFVQPSVQINYPNDFGYTRTVEVKHVTGQDTPHTNVVKEFPMDEGEPYYPFLDPTNKALAEKYRALIPAENRNNVFLTGRLADFRYYNMDKVMARAEEVYVNEIKPALENL